MISMLAEQSFSVRIAEPALLSLHAESAKIDIKKVMGYMMLPKLVYVSRLETVQITILSVLLQSDTFWSRIVTNNGLETLSCDVVGPRKV
jgi:hypothetical protein